MGSFTTELLKRAAFACSSLFLSRCRCFRFATRKATTFQAVVVGRVERLRDFDIPDLCRHFECLPAVFWNSAKGFRYSLFRPGSTFDASNQDSFGLSWKSSCYFAVDLGIFFARVTNQDELAFWELKKDRFDDFELVAFPGHEQPQNTGIAKSIRSQVERAVGKSMLGEKCVEWMIELPRA